MTGVALAFMLKPLNVPLQRILPSRRLPRGLLLTQKFKQICSSVAEIGLIEPLSIAAVDRKTGQHLLLDGHLRLEALRTLGRTEVACLVATDNEGYTYNNRVNRLSSVQEHLMIRRAVERGVSPERLAKSLCVDVSQIMQKMTLLDGICPEAAEMMRDRRFSPVVAIALRRMKPVRQIECTELMVSANNTTVSYARALLSATAPDMLWEKRRIVHARGVTHDQIIRMEQEMSNLQDQYRMAEDGYGEDILHLVLVRGYIVKLIDNPQVVGFLQKRQPGVLEQFQLLVQMTSMNG